MSKNNELEVQFRILDVMFEKYEEADKKLEELEKEQEI